MIYPFKSPFSYDSGTIKSWKSDAIGVYYCGVASSDGKLTIYYIGSGVSDDGIRGRLLQHVSESKWYDVTHFGYHVCDTTKEALDWEKQEIVRYKPKYNTMGV